ncbi:MAG: aspartate ammonia-lyase [bacterium]|nr:aspartate ammonia-lyase [bacterium]
MTRIEKDNLGELKIDDNKYYGIHTLRALSNFKISDRTTDLDLIKSIIIIKKVAAATNQELFLLPKEKAAAISKACDTLTVDSVNFPLDAMQGGAGTSTNMNVNEVIANYALEILGEKKGEYQKLHPIHDINKNQSTNDVYPTALRVTVLQKLAVLSDRIAALQGVLQRKEKEFSKVVKIGRTELQDAVPITLGREFAAFAEAIARDRWRVFKSEERLRMLNLGGTAVGTGLSAPREYIFEVTNKLRLETGLAIARSENLMDATANNDDLIEVGGMLGAHANNLIKISEDLRKMNMIGEISLPKRQAGSSIMPGKVNPVLVEAAIQAGIKVFANINAMRDAVSRSTFQICEFMPLVADSILESLNILIKINSLLIGYFKDINANEKKCYEIFSNSESLITIFIPDFGYEKCEQILKNFGGGNFIEFLRQELGQELVDIKTKPESLNSLGYKI